MFIGARFTQAGADLDVIRRHVREQNAFLLQRGLSDQTFAELEAIVHTFAFAIGITREQLQLRFLCAVPSII